MVSNLDHRRRVATLNIFYEISSNPGLALVVALPWFRVPAKLTHLVASVHF